MIILVIIVYGALAVYEFIPLYKEKKRNDLFLNGILFFLSFIIAIQLCLGLRLPSPARPIREVITSIFGK